MARSGRATWPALAVVVVAGVNAGAWAQCTANENSQCNATDGLSGEEFGFSLDLDGSALVVGALFANDTVGAAYVHRLDNGLWNEEAKLNSSDGQAGDRFGGAVAVSGDHVLIGAAGDDDSGTASGALYAFRFEDAVWSQGQKLLTTNASSGDSFGWSIAIDTTNAIVGAPGVMGVGASYVLVYDGDSWVEGPQLSPSDGGISDQFGSAVALAGDVAVVGARWHDENGFNSGAAYVFRFNGSDWIADGKLTATDGQPIDEFGSALAIQGNVVIVGAPGRDDGRGAAYVFEYNGSSWQEASTLLAWDSEIDHRFGRSVDYDGINLIVGATGDSETALNGGAAYLFQSDGANWVASAKLIASDAVANAALGSAASLGPSIAMIGAMGAGPGAVYVFEDPDAMCPDCPWDLDAGGTVSTADLLAVLAAWGTNPGGPPDFNGDGVVSTADLLETLGNWGPCP